MLHVTFSAEEAQILKNLINIALKTVGIEAAEAAIILTRRINEGKDVAEETKNADNPSV